MSSHTKNSTRIIIWIMAFVMAAGFIGSYFLVIVQNNNQKTDAQAKLEQSMKQQSTASQTPDPTAYKVEGPVTELKVEDITVGTGPEVKVGDSLRVHYKGTLAQTGVKFDSSYDRGEPATFTLAEGLVEGWVKGVPGMQAGGKRRLIIPSAMGYGPQGNGPTIPPDSDLVFEIELQAINPSE